MIDPFSLPWIITSSRLIIWLRRREELSKAYINLTPGDLFADLRQPNGRFCVKISDRLYSPQSAHAVARKWIDTITATWHHENNKSKATRCLLLSEVIVKLEKTRNTGEVRTCNTSVSSQALFHCAYFYILLIWCLNILNLEYSGTLTLF